ncbi:MAG: hypothetical protein LBJ70_04075 [Holosporales bacterium]|nr:hypothetical protein [Holosporales bacterium]
MDGAAAAPVGTRTQADLLGVQEVSLKEAAGPLLQAESLWTELLLRR